MTQRQIKLVENYIRGIVRKTLNESGDYSTSKFYDQRTGKSKTTGNSKKDAVVSAIERISNGSINDPILNKLEKIIPSKYDIYDDWPSSLWTKVYDFLKSENEL